MFCESVYGRIGRSRGNAVGTTAMFIALALTTASVVLPLPMKDDYKIQVTYHWQKRSIECAHVDGNYDVTHCALRTDIRNTDYGAGCFDEFVPAVRNIRNLCPLMCQGADDSDILAKVPTNNHKCNQFFNYGVTKFGEDMYVWRSGECLNATIRFDVRCGFPFKPQDFVSSNDMLFSLI